MTRGRPLRGLVLWWIIAGAGASIGGCAGGLEGPYGTNPAAVAHGAALAEQYCGSCHGLGPAGVSNAAGAPPFRAMRYDYNAISYERTLADWRLDRVHMPPAEMSLKDVGDIGAYVRSLKDAGRR